MYKTLQILLFNLLFGSGIFAQSFDFEAEAKAFQDSLNAYEKDPKTSHILAEELPDFKGLTFFPIEPSLRVMAKFVAVHDTHHFKLTYSNDPDVPLYISSGTLYFTINGVEHSLHTFQNEKWLDNPAFARHVFIPFKDWTNGPESYGGGRFIDAYLPEKGDLMVIDFNCCYNPPCAYNYYMACPLIPEDNHIECEIRAGVLAY